MSSASSASPVKETASTRLSSDSGVARQSSGSSREGLGRHERDTSDSSRLSDKVASPASSSSAERSDGTRNMNKGRSASRPPPAVVLCTIDGVQLNAIDVGGISSGAALRERMLSSVHVADDEMPTCSVHWGPLGELDDVGEPLSDGELLRMCRNISGLPNFHAFVVRNNGPLAYAPSGSATSPKPSVQPSPPLANARQLSDSIVHNYMLSDHPEDGSDEEEDVSQRRVSKSRTAQARRSDPVPYGGRMRSDSDPYSGERRPSHGRMSAEYAGQSMPQRPPSFDDGRRQHHSLYAEQEERARRAEFERMQNQRPSTASGAMGVPRPVAPPRGMPPYGTHPQAAPSHTQYPPNYLPPPPQNMAQRATPNANGLRPMMPAGYTPSRGPPGPSVNRTPSYPVGSSSSMGPSSRPVMPAHSVDDMRSHYQMQKPPPPMSGQYAAPRPALDPRASEPRGPRLDPRYAPQHDPRLYVDGRHAAGPRSMTPTPRSAPLPSAAQFPNNAHLGGYGRPPSGPSASHMQHQGPPMDPRRVPRHSPPMTAPPYATGYGPPPQQAQSSGRPPASSLHRAMTQPTPGSSVPASLAAGRPPPELLAGPYMSSPRPSASGPARSPTGASTPQFDARQSLPLQPGETLQDALSGGSVPKRSQHTLPRIETGLSDRRPSGESFVADVAKRPSPALDRPSSSGGPRRLSATDREISGGARRPSATELETAPAPISPARGGHTPSSSSSSSTSERRSNMPESLIPGRSAARRNDEASSPRKSEDESSTHTFSSGRPSSRSSQTSLNADSPVAPPPPACPAAPSAPELWEDDLDGTSHGDAKTWVSPETAKHRKTLSVGSEGDDQSRTARQKDWLPLDLGTSQGSLGLLDQGTLRKSGPAEMPSDDAFADDFADDIEASTWAGPRKSESEEGTDRTARPTLRLHIGDPAVASSVPAKMAALRQMSKGPSSSSDSSSTPRSSANLPSTSSTTTPSDGLSRVNARKSGAARVSGGSPVQRRPTMRGDVRPSAEQVYDNLDVFFPNHDLDKPILVDAPSSAGDSPSSPNVKGGVAAATAALTANAGTSVSSTAPTISRELRMGRHKSIRVVAKDRAKQMEQYKANDKAAAPLATSRHHPSSFGEKLSNIMRRKSTKLWGRKIEEVTPSQEGGIDAAISVAPAGTINEDSENFSFKIIMGDLIGKGSYGKVYLGINITTGDMLAVKQVELPKTASDRDDDRQTGSINALKFEIETLKDLDHPHIVQYLGFEQTLDHLSIFLEYIPGGSVGRWVRKFGKFGEDVVQSFTHQILDGLAYLHNHGILHRDLKADNCLVDGDGIIRISDFGISKKSSNVYEANEFMSMQGSIFWMAPEVVHNAKKGYSAKVDIWSLGCVVLEMFAGRRPWDTEMAIAAMFKIGAERLAPPVPEDVKLSPNADAFLSRCFIVDPQQRPTAEQLMRDPLMRIARNFDFKNTALGKAIAKASQATPPTSTPSQSQQA